MLNYHEKSLASHIRDPYRGHASASGGWKGHHRYHSSIARL
jgi:hypothetical protein